jgi:putative SOS response-associated peptidase YedK
MCYHKSLNATEAELEKRYKTALPPDVTYQPVYHTNAYQFPEWPILARWDQGADEKQFRMIRWGLIPHWTKSEANAEDIRTKTLNARAETIFDKPSFRASAQSGKRCLIPVTGFYEWYTQGSKKFPFYISTSDQKIASIAGLWDEWADPETGEVVPTYTLLTTEANSLLAAIHNSKKRMPCVLTPDAEEAWLREDLSKEDALKLLSETYPVKKMHSYSISKRITSRSEPSDVPDILEPASYPELATHKELFN